MTKQERAILRSEDYKGYRYDAEEDRQRRQEERERYAARHQAQASKMMFLRGR